MISVSHKAQSVKRKLNFLAFLCSIVNLVDAPAAGRAVPSVSPQRHEGGFFPHLTAAVFVVQYKCEPEGDLLNHQKAGAFFPYHLYKDIKL